MSDSVNGLNVECAAIKWLRCSGGARPGRAVAVMFFILKIYVGTHKKRHSFCQFADSETVKSIISLSPFFHRCLGNENCN